MKACGRWMLVGQERCRKKGCAKVVGSEGGSERVR